MGMNVKKDTERILLNSIDLKMIKHSFNEEVKINNTLEDEQQQRDNMSHRDSAFHRDNLNSSQGLI